MPKQPAADQIEQRISAAQAGAKREQLIGTKQTREMRIERRERDDGSLELAFSSEAPVERWYGREILDHTPGAMRLNRLSDGAPLLLQHDPDRQIGVIESARVDQDRIGRAIVRFSNSALGREIWQDVADGIRTKVSVGYIVHDMRLDQSGDDGDTYRVTDYEPLEISIVSIPADSSVGVGRNHPETVMPDDLNTPAGETPANQTAADTREQQPPIAARKDPVPDARPDDAPGGETRAFQHPDADLIRAIGRHFKCQDEAEDHIMLGRSLDDFRAKIAQRVPEPIPAAPRIEANIPYAGTLRTFTQALFGTRQRAEEMAYRAGQFYRFALFGDTRAARWCRDHGLLQNVRAMDGTGAGQQVLIPTELANTLISLKEQYGIAAQICDVVTMTTDSRTIAIDTDDLTAHWVGAGVAADESEPGFGFITLNAKRLRAKTVIDNDYADDSMIGLADHVAEKQARAFAIAEDDALFNGDGTSTYGGIVGIRTKLIGTAGAVDAASGHDTFLELTVADLRKLMAAAPDLPGYAPAWYCSKYAREQLFGRLADAAGGNTKRDLATGEQMQYAGYPIRTSPALPKVGTDLSDVAMVLFGDIRLGAKMGQRKAIEMMINPYALMDQGQTQILSFERIDFNIHGVGDASNPGPILGLFGE